MFVILPDQYLQPTYRISPFRTVDIALNFSLPENNSIEEYFLERFKGKEYQYTVNGREAINLALSYYHLQNVDVVSIFTSSGNFYVSSCLTTEIEKYCKWSRQIEKNTKVILVNHEFGFSYPSLNVLAKTGIPIIEDYAHSFFTEDRSGTSGVVSDFSVYSFPKMFPFQVGGLLVSNLKKRVEKKSIIDDLMLKYIKNVLSHYINYKDEIIDRRIQNYNYLKGRFEGLGFKERFQLAPGTVPGVYMFRSEELKVDLNELKKYFFRHGVQCSVFYGEEAFYVPVHQALNEIDLDYFYEIMRSFIKIHAI